MRYAASVSQLRQCRVLPRGALTRRGWAFAVEELMRDSCGLGGRMVGFDSRVAKLRSGW
jgi:hypothetical protein